MAKSSASGSGVEWSAQKFSDSLQRGDLYPLYFLYGDETFLIDEALATLQAKVLGESLRDFNLNTFYGEEAEANQLRDAIETLPMMASVRIIVLKEAQDLKDKHWEALSPVLKDPIDTSVFVCVGSKIDKRKKYIKQFQENGVIVEFKRPFENQIPDWIVSLGQRHGLQISLQIGSVLQQLVGSNLTDLNSEILKLSQFLGERSKPTVEDMISIVSRTRIDSVFDLAEAIGRNDRATSLDCLANLLDHGQSEVGVLALVTRHIRILKLVREGLREGLTGIKLATKAGVSPYFLKQYQEQSRKWSDAKIEQTFQALLETDRALKSSPVSAHIWLENFVVRTCDVSV
jgi:DNA polymerase-3 subunit delta